MADKQSTKPKRTRLLLVDDSKVVRSSAEKILGPEFEVVVAGGGEDGWKQIVSDPEIQAVFTDLGMPDLDGFGLLERIRRSRDSRISELPVIIVTGDEGEEAREDALRGGATDFVTKPFNRLDLLARARSITTYQQTTKLLRQQAHELEEISTVDPITRLGNRHHFIETLGRDRSFTSRHGQHISVLRIDVENLKSIILKFSEVEAANVLRTLAKVITGCVRSEDTVARIGPAQFGVILPACDPAGARRLAERIHRQISAYRFRIVGENVSVRTAIGVATPPLRHGLDSDGILNQAEKALQVASKKSGMRVEQLAPVGEAPVPAGTTTSATLGGTHLSLDEALAKLARGESEEVRPHIGNFFKRLMPLFEAADKRQKMQLLSLLRDLFAQRKRA